jgi:hypothetical protein
MEKGPNLWVRSRGDVIRYLPVGRYRTFTPDVAIIVARAAVSSVVPSPFAPNHFALKVPPEGTIRFHLPLPAVGAMMVPPLSVALDVASVVGYLVLVSETPTTHGANMTFMTTTTK